MKTNSLRSKRALCFTSGQVRSRQCRMAFSSRWLARTIGFWGDQPISFSSRETCDRSYVTPNSWSMTCATRPQVQISPRKPYDSAPWDKKSGNSHKSCWLSLRGAPGRSWAAKDFLPFRRADLSHWLTAPAVTPSACAISRCLQPVLCNTRARYRLASIQSVDAAVVIDKKFSYLCNAQ